MTAENLAVLKSGLEIVAAIKELVRRDKLDHQLNDQMCRALRTLYFTPNGILYLLREIEQSGGVLGKDLRERLIAFNDREWEVGRALELLDFERLRKDLRLTLATTNMLNQIRNGKISLRRSIQDEVNYYGQRGVRPDLKEVRTLIETIESLNAEILETERLVNSRAMER